MENGQTIIIRFTIIIIAQPIKKVHSRVLIEPFRPPNDCAKENSRFELRTLNHHERKLSTRVKSCPSHVRVSSH
jgi:hypothetical protein